MRHPQYQFHPMGLGGLPRSDLVVAGFDRLDGGCKRSCEDLFPTVPSRNPSTRPLRFLPSRTTTASTLVVPLGSRIRV